MYLVYQDPIVYQVLYVSRLPDLDIVYQVLYVSRLSGL